MKVIVEGADGVGKSTIVNNLAKTYNCDIVQMTKWGSRRYTDYSAKLTLDNVIFDRSFLSEMVYKQAFGLQPELSFGEFDRLIHDAKGQQWEFIILTAPVDVLTQRLINRGDEEDEIIKNIGFIDHLYHLYATSCNLPIFDTSKSHVMNEIRKELER